MITTEDKELLAHKKISEAQIAEQLKSFAKGFPFLQLDAAASIEEGILLPKTVEAQEFLNAWDDYLKEMVTVFLNLYRLLVLPAECLKTYLLL